MKSLVHILSTFDLDLDEDSTHEDDIVAGGCGEGFETENEVENHNATAEACEATQNLDFFLQEANDNLEGLVINQSYSAYLLFSFRTLSYPWPQNQEKLVFQLIF